MKEMRIPFLAKSSAACFACSSGKKAYSFPPGTLRSSRYWRSYCLAKSIAACGVLPISSEMALMRERSIFAGLAGREAAVSVPTKSSRRVIR